MARPVRFNYKRRLGRYRNVLKNSLY